MRSVWGVFVLLALIGGGLGVPPPVRAHEAVSVEEEFVKGVFSPAFTPAQLAKYARIYSADPKLWRFMTAPSERALDHALEGYGQDRAPVYDERGRFTGRYRHVLKVFLLDPAGYIRNVYSAGFLVPDLVLNDIKTVLGEGAPREVVKR